MGVEWGERSRWRAECQPGCYSVAYLPRAYIPPGKPSSFLQYGSATSTLVFRGLAHQSVRRPLTDERSPAAAGQCTASCCLSQSLTPSLHCQPLLHFWPPGSVPVSSGCFFGGPVIQFSQQRDTIKSWCRQVLPHDVVRVCTLLSQRHRQSCPGNRAVSLMLLSLRM